MRQHSLIKGFLFVGIFILFFASLSLLDHALRGDPVFLTNMRTFGGRDGVSLLFLGDSHAAFGVDETLLPRDWYNAAYPGDNLRDSFAKIRYAWEERHIKTIVISIDAYTFGTYRLADRNICLSLPFLSSIGARAVYGFTVLTYPLQRLQCAVPLLRKVQREKFMITLLARVKDRILTGDAAQNETASPALAEEKILRPGTDTLAGNIDKQMAGSLDEPELVAVMQNILAFAKEHGITMIGVRYPLSNQYLRDMQHYDLKSYEEAMQNLHFDAILDYQKLFAKKQELFKDISHLNPEGAKVFTKRVVKDISPLLSSALTR